MTGRRVGIVLASLCVLLDGCSGDKSDLKQYVSEVKARPAGSIEAIPETMPYTPYNYRAEDRRAPFTPTTTERDTKSNSKIAPNPDRAPDPLEAFPLDSLRMVGTISRADTRYALVHAPDNVIHRVRPGEHMGQNYGRIDAVSNEGVLLTEIVPDGKGGFKKRPASMAPSG